MTPEEHDRGEQPSDGAVAIGWLIILSPLALLFWGLVLFGIFGLTEAQRLFLPAVAHGGGIQYQACAYAPRFPVRLGIAPGVDPNPWRAAISEWNARFPGTFVEATPADAEIQPTTGRTWVRMGMCLSGPTIVYSGSDLRDWAAHELGHAGMALRDWIPATQDATGYINPGRCPGEYDGIMSYCGGRGFNADDDRMMEALR